MSRRGGVLFSQNIFFFSNPRQKHSVPSTQHLPAPGASTPKGGELGEGAARAQWSGPCPARAKPWLPGPSAGLRLAVAGWAPQPRVSAACKFASSFVTVAF